MAKVSKREQLLNYKCHKAYVEFRRKHKLEKDLKLSNRNEMHLVCSEIFRVIAENMSEREGGVCIEEFGYFFNWMIPKKMFGEKIVKGKPRQYNKNYHTNQHIYTLTYLPSDYFKGWAMDASFSKVIKKKVFKKIMDGYRYKGYPFTLKPYYEK